ncbi:MAG TPA: exodeoxyribonuclease VII large subunit [Gemmataceae bacterium]|jgi:exodeoxyribonuclease VII large subunit|nr:exodeoxyribonuclease VII large subunit [Gemmataceae bacterium]
MPATEPANVLSVSALTAQIRARLEGDFSSVWVSGEISNLSRPSSGHLYFSLKDEGAILGSVLYRGVGWRVRFEPRDGMHVIARGRVTIYPPHGKYQFSIEEIQPKGIGALELALQQLRDKLQTKGYFDDRRKKRLPAYPRSIALITSPSGAAVRDMLELLARRWPIARVFVVPVRVQGEGACHEIAAAIRAVNALHAAGSLHVDTMIVGRGGGSLEDLWAFNEEVVADAIFASRVVVVSAVGHEIDVTIADLVADHRALTPSHAVTDLTPDRDALLAGLAELNDRLQVGIGRRIDIARQRLDTIKDRRVFRNPLDRIRDWERRLDDLDGRLRRSVVVPIDRAGAKVASLAGRLEGLSPLNVLSRGYSLTRTPDGHVIHDASTVAAGDTIVTRLARGELVSRVEEVRPPASEAP